MNSETVAAAKTWLRDLYQSKHGKVPTDAELVEWCLQQWNTARTMVPKGSTPGQTLTRFTQDTDEFPGLTGAKA